jgi:hypothetical protein
VDAARAGFTRRQRPSRLPIDSAPPTPPDAENVGVQVGRDPGASAAAEPGVHGGARRVVLHLPAGSRLTVDLPPADPAGPAASELRRQVSVGSPGNGATR